MEFIIEKTSSWDSNKLTITTLEELLQFYESVKEKDWSDEIILRKEDNQYILEIYDQWRE
jgi:hypothetical protein